MPISTERVPNRSLSGPELAEIIKAKFNNVISRDGMFSGQLAFARVAFEVRVTLHLDNPVYPEHISTTLSQAASKQEVAANPNLAALEAGPVLQSPSDEAVVVSVQAEVQVQSPNAARIENGMPVWTVAANKDGIRVDTPIKYSGDAPDPESVGNTTTYKDVSEAQAGKMDVPSGRKRRT